MTLARNLRSEDAARYPKSHGEILKDAGALFPVGRGCSVGSMNGVISQGQTQREMWQDIIEFGIRPYSYTGFLQPKMLKYHINIKMYVF